MPQASLAAPGRLEIIRLGVRLGEEAGEDVRVGFDPCQRHERGKHRLVGRAPPGEPLAQRCQHVTRLTDQFDSLGR